jgi:type IV pilus assembly protein PilC
LPGFPNVDKLLSRLSPVKTNDIVLFYRQMALLIESGLNIVTSIELLEGQVANRILKRTLKDVIADIRSGSQFSAALSKHPEVFSAIDCQSIKVGERTGGLEQVLRQIADYTEKQINSRKSIKGAMTYPVIALVMAVVVVAVLVVFVFPTFKNLYASMGAQLPTLAKLTLNLGDLLYAYGAYLLLAGLVVAGAIWAYTRTTSGKYNLDRLYLKVPILGRVIHLNELSRVCRNIAVLYKAGLSLTEILPLVIQSSSNKVMAAALMRIHDDMLGGEGLSHPMSKHAIFMPMMVQMVRVGEETGNLDSTLLSVAQSYETEADDKTKSLISMIQPIATVAIGLVVGLMALSLVTAMYSMYGQTGI